MQNVPSLILLFPLLGFLFCAFFGKRVGQKTVACIAPTVVLASFVVAIWALVSLVNPAAEHRLVVPLIPFTSATAPWISFGGFKVFFALLLDPLSILMAMVVTGVGGLIHIYATGYMKDDKEFARFFTYFNLFIFMMLILVLAENFLLMFVGWEGVGTCSYLLISFWYKDIENAKAGNKAFIVNRVGDLGFALGMMAVWSVFGTLSFFGHHGQNGVMDLALHHISVSTQPLVALKIAGMPALTVICGLLFIGAIGKSAQIPLFMWLPDAMAGPTPVSALIHAATMVTAGVVMMTRCSWLFVQAPEVMKVVAGVGLATAVLGATIALVQTDIKKVLAYSTISQLGFMFLACGVGDFTAGMFHVTTHAFFKALLFLGAGAVIHSMLGEQDMRKMGGLSKKLKTTYYLMLIGTLAIAGFPFLSGFFSKDAILFSASRSLNSIGPINIGLLIYILGLGVSLLTAFYMCRLMMKTFLTRARWTVGGLVDQHHSNEEAHHDHGEHDTHEANSGNVIQSPNSMMIPLYILAFFSIVAGFWLGPTHILERFLEPSIANMTVVGGITQAKELFPEMAGYFISGIVAIAGLGLGVVLYRQHMDSGQLMNDEKRANSIGVEFLQNDWFFFNGAYDTFNRATQFVGDRILWRIIDKGLVDGIVNTIAKIVGSIGSGLRRTQTGYVRNYALTMLVGVVALVVSLYFTWVKLSR